MGDIDSFFMTPPVTGAGPGNVRSILYLLRRDLRDLTCPETQQIPNQDSIKAPVLAAAGISIGLEVLARIWVGENDPSQVKLVKSFSEILSISEAKAELIYRFRNSLLHGYQLELHARDRNIYRFCLHTNLVHPNFFDEGGVNGISEYTISFWELRRIFLVAVQVVYAKVTSDITHRENFLRVLPYLKPYKMDNGENLSKSPLST